MAIILGIRRVNAYTPAKYWCLYKNITVYYCSLVVFIKHRVCVGVCEDDVPLDD